MTLPTTVSNGNLREVAMKWGPRNSILAVAVGGILLILFPYFHLGVIYTFWNSNKLPVDRKACTCSCWDTLFKGSYESGAHSGYKHVYFNITRQTFSIWALTVVAIVLFYETVKHLTVLVFGRHARWTMMLLVASAVYPHYYGWWMFFNAWNDDFYKQWYHQSFFSLTEMVSTMAVVYLCDKRREPLPRLLLLIINVAVLHILASGVDQFISNVLYGKGAWHQFTRDIGFMVPDMMHIVLPLFELVQVARQHGKRITELFQWVDLALSVTGILILWLIVINL